MKRALVAFVLAFVLASCAPALGPTMPIAMDAVLTVTATDVGGLYRSDFTVPADRLVLLFTGEGLVANAAECSGSTVSIACVVRDVLSFYEIVVAGDVRLVEGIVDRGGEFGLLFLSEVPNVD